MAERRRSASRTARAGTVRVRTTAAAVVVVGLALVIASAGLLVSLRQSLTASVSDALSLRAEDIAEVLEAGLQPGRLAVESRRDSFIQVLDGRGRVVASSGNVARLPAVAKPAEDEVARVRGLPMSDAEFLVVAEEVDRANGNLWVLAGGTFDVVDESTASAVRALAIGVPIVLLIVGVTTWRIVGRALRPVEAMRSEVDAISAAELHRRVPQPATADEIARLAATMNRMLDRLEEAQARQRRLVSDASHELRSPVATIRQHAEVALRYPEGTSARDLARVVLDEDLRLERLVDDLLFLARADERALETVSRPIDLDDLVFEEAERLRATTELRIDTSAVSAGRTTGDAGHLRRLIRNLTDNAARYARTTVGVSLAEDDETAVLSVEDDGPGIEPGERARAFERFVRLDEARARASGGAGLGLSIAAEIVRAHGGTIALGEAALGGTRVEVRLPVRAD